MKRTYTVTVELPNEFKNAEDWKVQNLIASQIEKAQVHRKGRPEEGTVRLTVANIELVSEEQEAFESPLDELLGALFTSWSR